MLIVCFNTYHTIEVFFRLCERFRFMLYPTVIH